MSVIVDQDSGRVVWVGQGARANTLRKFFDEIGTSATADIEVVTMDMGRAFRTAVEELDLTPVIGYDPFHVVAAANRALDTLRKRVVASLRVDKASLRSLRWALLGSAGRLSPAHVAALDGLRTDRQVLWRAWALKEEMADLYRLPDPSLARAYLRRWLGRAPSTQLPRG